MNWTRRELLGGASAAAVALLAAGTAGAKPARPAMTVYRDPGCGCCGKWADLAMSVGYPVTVQFTDNIMAVKAEFGVPQSLLSCHTTKVGGYVVEGHVPFEAVAKLLRDKPRGIAGIAVPGMPAGAPGMEAHGDHGGHDHANHSIEVFAFTAAGESKAFAY